MKKKLAIVGTAPSSMGLAPFDDPEWDIWSLTVLYDKIPRWTHWYELHDVENIISMAKKEPQKFGGYLEFLQSIGPKVTIARPHPELPEATIFPKDEALERFGRGAFTSSISWMMAKAIMEGYEEIGLWGIDMVAQEEYAWQRPGCYYFLGVCKGQGIKTHLPLESDLMKVHKLYCFEDDNELRLLSIVRQKEIQQRIDMAKNQQRVATEEMQYLTGALDDLNYFLRNHF